MKLPADKLAHAVTGSALACAILCGCRLLHVPNVTACVIAAGAAIAAAIGKELWDWRHVGHTCDPLDALATVAGGALVILYPAMGVLL